MTVAEIGWPRSATQAGKDLPYTPTLRQRRPGRGGIYDACKAKAHAAAMFARTHDRTVFSDRRHHHRLLICVLGGHKPDLWPLFLSRFRAAIPPDADICLVSPGVYSKALESVCADAGWSYLSTSANDVSLAQNVCFRLHGACETIVKLDEDMFLLPNTIVNLLAEHRAIKADGEVDPGFVAPMIPLNGFCYRHLLATIGCLDEFERMFGRARMAASGVPLQCDPAAAEWIWRQTSPLSATADLLAARPTQRLFCPIQFSIGMIAFDRSFWELIGAFPVSRRRLAFGISTLGGDEAYLCSKAIQMSRPMVVTTAALAGHFSFGPQYTALKALLLERPDLFAS